MTLRLQPSDGRVARRLDNRERIVTALFDLIVSGSSQPTLQEIATEAGVTSRTLLNHFPDLGALLVATVAFGRTRAAAELPAIPQHHDPEQRVRLFFARATKFFDRYAALRWSALTFKGELHGFAAKQRSGNGHDSIERRVLELLEPFELRARKDVELERSLLAAVDPLSWRLLRVQQGLSPAAAAASLARTVLALASSARRR